MNDKPDIRDFLTVLLCILLYGTVGAAEILPDRTTNSQIRASR